MGQQRDADDGAASRMPHDALRCKRKRAGAPPSDRDAALMVDRMMSLPRKQLPVMEQEDEESLDATGE